MVRPRCYIAAVLVVLVFTAIGFIVYNTLKPISLPHVDVNQYWGPGPSDFYTENTAIRPMKISYSNEKIESIRRKLNETSHFTPTLEDTYDEYGINIEQLKSMITYWRDTYLTNWESRQAFLNQHPHFLTQIQGLDIHFVYVKPSEQAARNKRVVPLLLLHGWPGSVREFYELIELLTKPDEESSIVFELVIPSLPGFGWSDGARKTGLGALEVSVIFRNLMLRLGHEKFYIQGGDWGSVIGSALATVFPDNVIGYHSNFCALFTPKAFVKGAVASVYPSAFINAKYQSFVFPMKAKLAHLVQESGFAHLQATKPDTIGAALTDNPAGLAAYILEKYSKWFEKLSKEAILDNLSIYALTNSFPTSARLYAESYSARQLAFNLPSIPTNVPTCCVRFKEDIGHALDWQLRDKYPNMIQSTWYEEGGHFAAMEVPEVLHNDFRQFFEKVERLGGSSK